MKITSGNFYRTRDGQKVGPMVKYRFRDVFHLPKHKKVDGVMTWWPDGRADYHKHDNPIDLVSEWVEPND